MSRHGIVETTLIATLALTVPAVSSAQTTEGAVLAVRVFNVAGVPARDLEAALAEAGAVLDESGVAVSWNRCSDSRHRPPVCDRGLADGEVIVRLVAARDTSVSASVAMGDASVDPTRRRSVLANVYWTRVVAVARGACIDPQPLLGRAIAHEIGHLLINTTGHATAGLMRAEWSQAELRRNAARDWRFGDVEARVMRASLATTH